MEKSGGEFVLAGLRDKYHPGSRSDTRYHPSSSSIDVYIPALGSVTLRS